MKLMKWLLVVCCFLMMGARVWGDDDFPPEWRLAEPGTLIVEFDDWPGFAAGGFVTPPDFWSSNPGLPMGPEAERVNAGFLAGMFPRQNIVRVDGPDGLILKLGNFSQMNPQKLILIQVTYLAEEAGGVDPIMMYGFNVWLGWGMQGPHFFFPANGHMVYRSEIKPGGWITEAYLLELEPNPEMETIGLKFDRYPVLVDQVVIDTWCRGENSELDFGDAPDRPYPTLFANNGARHVIVPGVYMGAFVDPEPDGQPTATADGDDINPIGGPDDEDGVLFLTAPLVAGFPAQVEVTVSADGFIDAWVDFEKNGDWAHPLEQIFASVPVTTGVNVLTFTVPSGLGGGVSTPVTYARFRFSTVGGLHYTGEAPDGEVEDYEVLVEEEILDAADLGDAPDSSNNLGVLMDAYPGVVAHYPTVFNDVTGGAPHGPIHWQARSVAYLGEWVSLEVEADSGPDEDLVNNLDLLNVMSDLDNDDDGVLGLPLHLPYCQYTTFDYVVTIAGATVQPTLYVNAWFDWNRDGDWDDVLAPVCGERRVPEWAVQNQVLTGLGAGQQTLSSPAFRCWHPILEGGPEEIWMRITLSESPWSPSGGMLGDGGSGPAGGYGVGETEDYVFVPDTHCERCADLNCDGVVSLPDLAILAWRWLNTCP